MKKLMFSLTIFFALIFSGQAAWSQTQTQTKKNIKTQTAAADTGKYAACFNFYHSPDTLALWCESRITLSDAHCTAKQWSAKTATDLNILNQWERFRIADDTVVKIIPAYVPYILRHLDEFGLEIGTSLGAVDNGWYAVLRTNPNSFWRATDTQQPGQVASIRSKKSKAGIVKLENCCNPRYEKDLEKELRSIYGSPVPGGSNTPTTVVVPGGSSSASPKTLTIPPVQAGTGTAGPQGPAGPTGPQGTQGQQGAYQPGMSSNIFTAQEAFEGQNSALIVENAEAKRFVWQYQQIQEANSDYNHELTKDQVSLIEAQGKATAEVAEAKNSCCCNGCGNGSSSTASTAANTTTSGYDPTVGQQLKGIKGALIAQDVISGGNMVANFWQGAEQTRIADYLDNQPLYQQQQVVYQQPSSYWHFYQDQNNNNDGNTSVHQHWYNIGK